MNLMDRIRFFVSRLRIWFLRSSISNRVLIGNSFIIIFGAIAGTIFTRQLTLFGNIRLILLFSFFGILITLAVNYWIIRTALHPLRELGNVLEQTVDGEIRIPNSLKKYGDPSIHHLVTALDSMLLRLANRTSQLQAISERAINAQEEERIRIARGLHDDTAQALSMLIIQVERLEKLIPAESSELKKHVTEIHKSLTRLLEDLRKIIWNLRPSILDDLGLLPAIRWYARSNLEERGILIDFGMSADNMRLPAHLETTLFRVTQEAVNNILRHADAKNVSVRLQSRQGQICLDVKDDGHGFDMERVSGEALSKKQLGLLGIKERVSLVGGQVNVESALGSGTSVHVTIPLPGEDLLEINNIDNASLSKK